MSNVVTHSERANFHGDEWACFEKLPRAIRYALHEGIVQWSALEVRWMMNKRVKGGLSKEDAAKAEVAEIRAADVREVNQFAHHWPSRFGRLTPHVRAQATIVRYDERQRVRAKRLGAP